MLKMQPEMIRGKKIKLFHANLRKEALQSFNNISAPNTKTLKDVIMFSRTEYVKQALQSTTKHKWHNFRFNSKTISSPDFLGELIEIVKTARDDVSQHLTVFYTLNNNRT